MNIRRIAIVAVLALVAGTAHAGSSVTYEFQEQGLFGSNIGGYLTFASPPASATTGWSTSSLSDVLNFQITDPNIGYGTITPNSITAPVGSSTGAVLDSGALTEYDMHGYVLAGATFGPGFEGGFLEAQNGYAAGTWLVVASVPEPSSLLLAGIGAIVGLGYVRARRRRAA